MAHIVHQLNLLSYILLIWLLVNVMYTTLHIYWLWLKTYWSYIALTVSLLMLFVISRYQDLQFTKQFKTISDGYDEEIKKLHAARLKERQQLEANQKILEAKLVTIEKQYSTRMHELDNRKRAEVERLVRTYKNDPDKLATEISKRTGFRIVYPIPEINPYE